MGIKITFHTSTQCNLRCTYCYQKNKVYPIMSFDIAKKVLDDLFEYKQFRTGKIFKYTILFENLIDEPPILDFFGGECTLQIDLINQICEYFESCCKKFNYKFWLDNYLINMQSNGTTLARNTKIATFNDKFKPHIRWAISIDGCKECHNICRLDKNGFGTYDSVVEGINYIKDTFGYTPLTKLTFTKENMPYIQRSISNLQLLGYNYAPGYFDQISANQQLTLTEHNLYYECLKEAIDYIIDNEIYFQWGITDKLQTLAASTEPFKQASCGSNGEYLAVKWDGKLYFCPQMSESFTLSAKNELCLGTVDMGVTNFNIIDKLRNNTSYISEAECTDCPFKCLCEPCIARNLRLSGQYNNYKFNCGASLAEIKALFYFIERAIETDYPYFKELIAEVHSRFPNGLPNRVYLIDRNNK